LAGASGRCAGFRGSGAARLRAHRRWRSTNREGTRDAASLTVGCQEGGDTDKDAKEAYETSRKAVTSGIAVPQWCRRLTVRRPRCPALTNVLAVTVDGLCRSSRLGSTSSFPTIRAGLYRLSRQDSSTASRVGAAENSAAVSPLPPKSAAVASCGLRKGFFELSSRGCPLTAPKMGKLFSILPTLWFRNTWSWSPASENRYCAPSRARGN
jgi:hypothetical protein